MCVCVCLCKNVCVTSSHRTSYPPFLSVPHSLPTTLSLWYSLGLAMFSPCCRSVSVQIVQRLSSAFILTSLYPTIIVFSSTYTTYFLHTPHIVFFTYTWVTCSSTLSGHPSSSFIALPSNFTFIYPIFHTFPSKETLGAQGLLGCFILFTVWLYQLATRTQGSPPLQIPVETRGTLVETYST